MLSFKRIPETVDHKATRRFVSRSPLQLRRRDIVAVEGPPEDPSELGGSLMGMVSIT